MSPRMQTLGSGDLSDLTKQNFGHQRSASAEERGGTVRGVARKIVKKGANKTMWDISSLLRRWLHSVQSCCLWSFKTIIIDLFVARKFIYNLLTFLLTLTLIMGVSIFTYGTFYFAYMPTEVRRWHTIIDIAMSLQHTPGPWGGSKFSV